MQKYMNMHVSYMNTYIHIFNLGC